VLNDFYTKYQQFALGRTSAVTPAELAVSTPAFSLNQSPGWIPAGSALEIADFELVLG
jgi:hypothetical protein